MIGVQADTTGILGATAQTLRRMGQLTGFDQRTVLLSFAGVVLKTWAGRTKVATEASIDRKSRLHAVSSLGHTGKGRPSPRGDVTVNAGFRNPHYGRVWIRVRNGAGRQNWLLALGDNFTQPGGVVRTIGLAKSRKGVGSRVVRGVFNVWPNRPKATTAQWINSIASAVDQVTAKVPQSIKKGRASVALSRQSVVQIADAIGIDLLRVKGGGSLSGAGIAKARAALASTGKAYRNGTGARGGDTVRAYVDLINRLPYGRKIGMDRTLLGVLAGQNKYFERSYAKGAFDTQKRACLAFPNLFKYREFANLS